MTEGVPEQPDDAGAPPPAQSRSWWRVPFAHLDRFINNGLLKNLVAISEIVAMVVLVIGGVRWMVNLFSDDDPTGTGTPSSSVSVPPSSTPTLPTSPPATTALSPSGPRCWTVSRVLIDCREAHRYEEIPQPQACNQAAVIDYLGGLTALDVSVARPGAAPGGGCWLDAGRTVSGSAQGVLQSESAPSWRRCVDQRTAKNVPCSALHSGEYLATGSLRRATDAECQVAAAKYMDQNPGNLIEDLMIHVLPVSSTSTDPARCTILARGNHLLTTSVRALGSRPVPIYSQ